MSRIDEDYPCDALGSAERRFFSKDEGGKWVKNRKKKKRVPVKNPETLSISWCPLRDSNTGHTD